MWGKSVKHRSLLRTLLNAYVNFVAQLGLNYEPKCCSGISLSDAYSLRHMLDFVFRASVSVTQLIRRRQIAQMLAQCQWPCAMPIWASHSCLGVSDSSWKTHVRTKRLSVRLKSVTYATSVWTSYLSVGVSASPWTMSSLTNRLTVVGLKSVPCEAPVWTSFLIVGVSESPWKMSLWTNRLIVVGCEIVTHLRGVALSVGLKSAPCRYLCGQTFVSRWNDIG